MLEYTSIIRNKENENYEIHSINILNRQFFQFVYYALEMTDSNLYINFREFSLYHILELLNIIRPCIIISIIFQIIQIYLHF